MLVFKVREGEGFVLSVYGHLILVDFIDNPKGSGLCARIHNCDADVARTEFNQIGFGEKNTRRKCEGLHRAVASILRAQGTPTRVKSQPWLNSLQIHERLHEECNPGPK